MKVDENSVNKVKLSLYQIVILFIYVSSDITILPTCACPIYLNLFYFNQTKICLLYNFSHFSSFSCLMTKPNCVIKHLTANLYDPCGIRYNFLRIIPN